MATIAEQLTSLANTKTAIKDAIVAKGVAVADTDPFSAYPDKIGQIQAGGGGAPATKFGASVDTWIGDVDENGVLQKITWTGDLNFSGVKEIGTYALQYAFYNRTGITNVDLSSVESVSEYGLYYAFYGSSVQSVGFSSLESVDAYGMYNAFNGALGLVGHLDLSALKTVGYIGLNYAFRETGITSVDFSSLESVGVQGTQAMFYNGKINTPVYFPKLTTVSPTSFASSTTNGMFRNCTGLTEIHFRADMQATIEAMTGYSNKWGATNASIIFDL